MKEFHAFIDTLEAQLHIKNPRTLILYAIFAVIGFLALVPIATYLYFANDLASKETIMNSNNTGVVLQDRNGKTFFTFYQAKSREFVSLSDIPVFTRQALIAAEDKDFYSHPGFSIPSIARSLVSDVKQTQLAYGGSTITQQLVKNALLTPQKNFLRKYQEVVLASEIERRYTKNEILEMYLNSVYFGEGAIGIQAAAETYFGIDAKDLTLAQSALLAAILPAPSAFSPISGDKDEAFRRQKLVLDKMTAQGFITKTQAEAAKTQEIALHPSKKEFNNIAPHYALMVKDKLINKYGEEAVARSGFTVKTSLDLDMQQYAETVVENQVQRLQYNDASNGAAVAIDPKTGEILVLVGSHDWNDTDNGKINMATTPRQPGSSFKPIVYSLAFLQEKITPSTLLKDQPTTFPGNYKPLDYDRKFRGPVLPRRALANSLNIPAVEVMEKVGIPDVLDYAKTLGITTLQNPSQYGLSLVLGGGEVPLTEMTNAYAVFADQGQKNSLTSILEIHDKRGQNIYTYRPTSEEVLDPRVAFMISSILSDNSARAEEFGNALTISRPAAVKTGTTENYRDALTIGYTPSLVVGVWVGNNDNSPMDNIAGSLGAAPIWRSLMTRFLQATPIEQFKEPTGLLKLSICRNNGYRLNGATSSAYFEYYLPGTTPTQDCNSPISPTAQPSNTPEATKPSQPTDTPRPAQPTDTPKPNPTDTPTPTPTPSGQTIEVTVSPH